MKTKVIILSLLLFQNAFSAESEFNKQVCVRSDLNKIQNLFTQYGDYASKPGSAYIKETPLGSMPIVRMSESKAYSIKNEPDSKYVAIVLQPSNLSNNDLYPKFTMKCTVERNNTDQQFSQNCVMIPRTGDLGLDDIKIKVYSNRNSSKCAANLTNLYISVKITTNPKEVSLIKSEVFKFAGPLAPFISELFDESLFFEGYFDHLYTEWFKTL